MRNMRKSQKKVLPLNILKIIETAKSLLVKMLERDPKTRISATKSLSHRFFLESTNPLDKSDDSAETPLFFEPSTFDPESLTK